ncbi:nucleotide pyrophosphohydrolase [Candidatus Woesearchaeota archaeon]|nr:nucleotide pyrophosphohydrolase [Candidatus Woesearchaeota archaeon]
MTLRDIQKQVDEWASQFKLPYWQPLEILARLVEETGELARELNHRFGAKKKKETEPKGDLGDEITDVMFTLCCLANREGIDLQAEWDKMMGKKLYGRDNQRFERK